MNMNQSKLWEFMKDREDWCPTVHGVAKSWTRIRTHTLVPVSQSIFLNLGLLQADCLLSEIQGRPMYMYIPYLFLIHSFASGHLVCFLAIVNSAAVNLGVHVSF